jgi:hypothetical protein
MPKGALNLISHPPSGDHTSDTEAIQIRPDSRQISVLLNLTFLANNTNMIHLGMLSVQQRKTE